MVRVALFKDSEAGARAVGCKYSPSGDYLTCVSFRYSMVAGGTSAITFKLRFGGAGGGTVYVNGTGGDGRRFGGVMRSGLTVTEITE